MLETVPKSLQWLMPLQPPGSSPLARNCQSVGWQGKG